MSKTGRENSETAKATSSSGPNSTTTANSIRAIFPLGLHWRTQEPFLFCAHHLDRYPAGNGQYAPPTAALVGRAIGSDFEEKDGFRMYHGESVPGFPVHPHRGFETITIVREGFADHADSLGAGGRYGQGDVQWMTAGSGVQHSEMFPLLHTDQPNTVDLFQIWLNLPRRNKMAAPHYKMFWSEKIPKVSLDDGRVELTLIAGSHGQQKALTPPPASWASEDAAEVAIHLLKLKSGGRFTLAPKAPPFARSLYFFTGTRIKIDEAELAVSHGVELDPRIPSTITALDDDSEILILEGRPIGEPVVQHGPFVMNSRDEIVQAISDYQRTRFGGWKWPRPDMVHGSKIERFAQHPDGRIERPED